MSPVHTNTHPSASADRALALYIHWPWCKKKCPYCDFNSHVAEHIPEEAYIRALQTELKALKTRVSEDLLTRPISSIFFGGGTPSLMAPESVAAILQTAQETFGFTKDIEITLEANPTSAEANNFTGYVSAGVNRFSVGVQSLQQKWLDFLGREHSADEALRVIDMALQATPNINLDLIYGMDGQTLKSWQQDLTKAASIGTKHVSAYQLTIEPNTVFYALHKRGKLSEMESDQQADFYQATGDILAQKGFKQYEISNYAKDGYHCAHNTHIWRYGAYMGIGAGAHGRLPFKDKGWCATANKKMPTGYMQTVAETGLGLYEHTTVSADLQAAEALLMGLRLSEGVDTRRLENMGEQAAFDKKACQELASLGYLELTDTTLKLTEKGRPLLNSILPQLMSKDWQDNAY